MNRQMNKQTVVQTHNRILLNPKKERGTDTSYNQEEPWKHCTDWKKPGTKGDMLYDSAYKKSPEEANL